MLFNMVKYRTVSDFGQSQKSSLTSVSQRSMCHVFTQSNRSIYVQGHSEYRNGISRFFKTNCKLQLILSERNTCKMSG